MIYAEIVNISDYISIVFSTIIFHRKMFILDFLLNQFWNHAREIMYATKVKSIQKAVQATLASQR